MTIMTEIKFIIVNTIILSCSINIIMQPMFSGQLITFSLLES
jgi:hypothetical protein